MKTIWVMIISILLCTACSEKPARTSLFARQDSRSAKAPVTLENPVTLPKDHASHPDYELEWWYLTFILQDQHNTPYGLQFTLFRFTTPQGYPSNWSDAQQWMGHASLHSPDRHVFESRYAAGGVGNASVSAAPFTAWIDDWHWRASGDAPFPATLEFTIDKTARVNLQLSAEGPYVRHGDDGISIKSRHADFKSYYYSQPFLRAKGQIQVDSTIMPVSGQAWYDHEWTSELARQTALGWDWFSIHFDNGDKLMAFQMHVEGEAPYTIGTYIRSDGTLSPLAETDLTIRDIGTERINDKPVPVRWAIAIEKHNVDIEITPFKTGQWNPGRFAYYEGRVTVSGTHSGNGFMELTGYQ